jgi:mRNA interferase RelE/StbE
MFSLRILDAAAHDLAALDKQIATRIVKRIYWLAENFDSVKPQSLTGDLSDLYKLRVGDYRILYEALREEKVLVIHAVGHRREIYRSK